MRVLIVDDDEKLAIFLKCLVEELGHVAEAVFDGCEGLEQAANLSYDLLLAGGQMPDMDALTLIRKLRAQGVSMPAIMLTGSGEAQRIAGLDAGADDCLSKPFDPAELLARIRALSRRCTSDGVLRTGPLTLEKVERVVRLSGVKLDLTAREFSLLRYLMHCAGRAVSRAELLANVWNLDHDPGTNLIDAQVKKLREKLSPRGELIETVRGLGYRLSLNAAECTS